MREIVLIAQKATIMRVHTTVEQAQALPCYHRETIPAAYLDAMGHMNVQFYMALFDAAGWAFFAALGMTDEYYRTQHAGGFALKQHIIYVAEVREGDTVAVHTRAINRSEKRVHFLHFIVNETRHNVAATLEGVGSHADLRARRTSPYPPHIAANLDALITEHQTLDWDAPLCGVLSV